MELDDYLKGLSERILSKSITAEDENNYTESMFESIRHVNEHGQEFWYARELQIALDYTEWRNFKKVIEHAVIACQNSENTVSDHFVEVNKMVNIGSGAERDLKIYSCHAMLVTSLFRMVIHVKNNSSRSNLFCRKNKTAGID